MARQLGTLTIDLIAKIGGFIKGMTDAERAADKKSRDMERKFKQSADSVGKAWSGIGAVVTASIAGISVGGAVAGIVSLANETAKSAKEIEQFSRVANTTTDRFQELTYGASQVGVSGEKLADIFKDVQDKFGDFAQNGGGEMKDFFENVGSRVGVTIEQFRKLSGPDALQLFYSSLEKANLSQQDMVFYLEAVANDATLLQPLLQDNGKAWEQLAAEARKYGLVLDKEALEASAAYREETRKLEANLQGIKNTVAVEVLPALTQLNSTLADENTRQAFATLMGWVTQLTNVVITATANIMAFATAKNKLASLLRTDDFSKLKAGAEGASAHVERLTGTLERHQEALDRDPGNAKLQRNVKVTRGLLDKAQASAMGASDALKNWANQNDVVAPKIELPPVVNPKGALSPAKPPKASGGTTKKPEKTQAEKDAEAAEKFLQTLKEQAFKAQEKTAYEQLFFDIQHKGLKLSKDQLDTATGLVATIDMAKEGEAARAAQIERNTELYELENRVLAKNQQYQLELLTFGMGDKAAAQLRERIALLQQHQQELMKMQQDRDLALAGAETDKDRERVTARFTERLAMVKTAQQMELDAYDEFLAQKRAREDNWMAGAQSALNTYLEQSRDMYSQVQGIASRALGSTEDMLVNMVKTGKMNMGDLLASIGEDVVRMLVKMGIQMVANKLLGDTLQAAGVATSVAAGTATAAAWAPAAAMASLASFGANAVPAAAGITSTTALATALAAVPGFSTGGYTGPGGKHQPAGVVHAGEVVWSQVDIARAGGVDVVEAMRKGYRGYADGGAVRLPPAARPDYARELQGGGTIVNVVEDSSRAGEVEQTTNERGEELINVFVRNLHSGGEAAMAFEGIYGLSRRGR